MFRASQTKCDRVDRLYIKYIKGAYKLQTHLPRCDGLGNNFTLIAARAPSYDIEGLAAVKRVSKKYLECTLLSLTKMTNYVSDDS